MRKTGIELIANERAEQLTKHNRTVEKDAAYNANEELRIFFMILLSEGANGEFSESDLELMPDGWDEKLCRKMLLKPYKERLVIGGALIAAEIDRIQFEQTRKLQHPFRIYKP